MHLPQTQQLEGDEALAQRPPVRPQHPKQSAEAPTKNATSTTTTTTATTTAEPMEEECCDYYYDAKDTDDLISSSCSPEDGKTDPPRETFYISSYQRSFSWASNLSFATLDSASLTTTTTLSTDDNASSITRRSSSASLTSARLLKLMRPFSRSQERSSSI
ncbi:uncharacterized protein SEPMUDRAFT_106505 [Sphaerulina musiva SO2202]|uniref:Uncharacterized protein n=1 Tax=Sphaerulina musiva (strain SO2202) TaxID=692275 RepID=M3D8D3_SPHMS|nr:uncharacterized protein SEPMUDRAFT_106505 [Sphaerulina musiva SO2202]EMF14139.1 hypothetical protein SEPMUDRAFT_106505 [Sphaerulina musiva SO2202]